MKIIVTVHLEAIIDLNGLKLSRKYKFKIIEDASHALGASSKNKIDLKWSDISVFCFHPSIITTFEGGAATTNNLNISTN